MKKLKVLIVDDEVMLQEIYIMALESEFPCEFLCVSNGNEGIEALKGQGPFDLILSDYRMPVANGGKLYLFNKTLHNTPFFLFSGGFLEDYAEFSDFYQVNSENHFFGKPFYEDKIVEAVKGLQCFKNLKFSDAELTAEATRFIRANLRHFLHYTDSAAEVYIKLSEDKFTKIVDANKENLPEKELLNHYLNKGINTIYIEKRYFPSLMQDVYKHFQHKLLGEKKKEEVIELGGVPFKVCFEGLSEIGMGQVTIARTNDMIHHTVISILEDEETRERFKTYCTHQGFGVGHSLLIMYIAACICQKSGLNFSNTMKKICTAAFFHDFSLFEMESIEDDMDHKKALISEVLFNHPVQSADLLPSSLEIFEDTKKIILEHHEKPNGDGYPKRLNAHNISPLSCLFILAEEITFNLIRNDFDKERMQDFIQYLHKNYSQGNFSKFLKDLEATFVSCT